MKYFKNTELAKLYNVSEKSVRNWIQAAQDGKLDLQLYNKGSRFFIVDTSRNTVVIQGLVQKGKKYKNTRAYKVVQPKPKFYSLYNTKQIFDIISSIDTYHELPRQYNYFDGGADFWDKYVQRLVNESTANITTSTLELLDINEDYLNHLLEKYKRINVIDIGVGNAIPVKNLLARLHNKGKLGRYIGLDISSEMLKIARNNIAKWFDGKIVLEAHEIDISYERFTEILADEYIKENSQDTVNLVLVLGGTLGNLRSPDGAFKVIHDSMGRNDLLVQTLKLDTETTRRYFDFNIDTKLQPLAPQYKYLVDLLNIDESFYSVEMGYEEDTKARFLRIRLKVALSIKFTFGDGERIIDLNKDDALLLWRYWHQDMHDFIHQLDRNDFHPLLTSQTGDKEYLLTVAQVKSWR